VVLLLLNNMVVEDVHRLVVYFLQSSFRWENGDVAQIASRLDELISQPPATSPRSAADRGAPDHASETALTWWPGHARRSSRISGATSRS